MDRQQPPSPRNAGRPPLVGAGAAAPSGDARALLRELRRRGLGVRPTARGVRVLHPGGVPAALRERRRLGDARARALRRHMVGRALARSRTIRRLLGALASLRGRAPTALVAAVAGLDEGLAGRALAMLAGWGLVARERRERAGVSWEEWRILVDEVAAAEAGLPR